MGVAARAEVIRASRTVMCLGNPRQGARTSVPIRASCTLDGILNPRPDERDLRLVTLRETSASIRVS